MAETPLKATLTVEYVDATVSADLQPEAAEWLLEAMRNQSIGRSLVSLKEILQSESEVQK